MSAYDDLPDPSDTVASVGAPDDERFPNLYDAQTLTGFEAINPRYGHPVDAHEQMVGFVRGLNRVVAHRTIRVAIILCPVVYLAMILVGLLT